MDVLCLIITFCHVIELRQHWTFCLGNFPLTMLDMRTESIEHNISNNIGQGERGENFPRFVSMVVGLRLDTYKFSLQLNFCFLLARYYIWCCRVSEKIPILTTFLVSLKSQFCIQSNNLEAVSKKWNPLLPLLNIT